MKEGEYMEDLTQREKDVLFYLVKGYTNIEIGKFLSISKHTVKFHVTTILKKLNCQDRTEAAYFAGKHNII